MKKLMMVMMCVTLLAGCGNDDKKNNNDNNTANNNNVTDTNDNKTNTNDNWFDRFESDLKGKNVNYSNKTSLDATTIGGAEGYRYATENGNIDVYRFEDGDELNRIMKEKKIRMNDKDTNVEVNDHYVIVSDGLSDDIMNVFRGLK